MNFDLIICTKNRPLELEICLERLDISAHENKNKDKWKITIVNDGDEVKINYKKYTNLKIQIIESDKKGLSSSRNLGIEKTNNEIIVFIDDDAFVHKDFMNKVQVSWSQNNNNSIAVICGEPKALILDEVQRRWYEKQKDICRPISYMYSVDLQIAGERIIMPKNMGVIEAVVTCSRDKLGDKRFNPKLGRVNNLLLSGEGILFEQISREKNYELYYDPEIVVDHLIDSKRLNKQWLMKRLFWQGVTESFLYKMKYRENFNISNQIENNYLISKEDFIEIKDFAHILNTGRIAGLYMDI